MLALSTAYAYFFGQLKINMWVLLETRFESVASHKFVSLYHNTYYSNIITIDSLCGETILLLYK